MTDRLHPVWHCDGDHPEPVCGDPKCWLTEEMSAWELVREVTRAQGMRDAKIVAEVDGRRANALSVTYLREQNTIVIGNKP